MQWDPSIPRWLLGECDDRNDRQGWERLVDERLSPILTEYLPADAAEKRAVCVKREQQRVVVEPAAPAAPDPPEAQAKPRRQRPRQASQKRGGA